MARQGNYETAGSSALEPEVEQPTNSGPRLFSSDGKRVSASDSRVSRANHQRKSATTPKSSRNNNILTSDFRKTGIAKDLDTPTTVTKFPAPDTMSLNSVRRHENNASKIKGGSMNYKPPAPAGEKTMFQRLGGFLGKHKKASIVAMSGALVGGIMALLGGMMSGPTSILHAAAFVGDIADTPKDISTIVRMTKKVAKSAKATDAIKDGKTFIKNNKQINSVSKFVSGKLTAVKGAEAVSKITSFSNKVSSMTSRVAERVNKILDFHPMKKLTSIIKSTKLGRRAILLKKMAARFIKKKIKAVAAKAAAATAGRIAVTVAGKISSLVKADKGAFKGFTTFLKASGVGTTLGYIASFAFELAIRRMSAVSFETNLGIAAGKSQEFTAVASQMKSGDFPTTTEMAEDGELEEDETEEDGVPAQELGLFVEANLYQEAEVVNVPEDSQCYAEYENTPKDGDDEEENAQAWAEYDERVKGCLDAIEGDADGHIETQSFSFWDATMVKHELGDPAYQTHESLTKSTSVPPQLIAGTYDKKLTEYTVNSLIATVAFGFAPDMFGFGSDDGALDLDSSNPTVIGNGVTAGARSLSNTRMATSGGYSYDEGSKEAIAINNARKQYVQDEFNARPLYARLFDVEDYKSAVVTLARESGWNTADPSIGTQLKNVAKTFAKLPTLIASSLNKLSYAGASGTSSDFYGFGIVGFTEKQLEEFPDFEIAADGIIKYHSEIKKDNLKYSGIADITESGRVTYKEDTDAKDLDIRARKAKPLGGDTEYGVTICDDGSFVWDDEDPDGTIAAACFTETIVEKKAVNQSSDSRIASTDLTDLSDDDIAEFVVAGHTSFTVDEMVRTYLLDYPIMMSAAASDYKENIDEFDLSDEDKSDISKQLDEAMRDMGIMTGAASATPVDGDNQTIAEQLLEMQKRNELKMKDWSCVQGSSVKKDIEYIAENNRARYFKNGNCSSPDTKVDLAEGLMKFIIAAAEKMKENDMVLTIYSLVASNGAPDDDDLDHSKGRAVDLVCPSGKESECQKLLDEVGAEYGMSALIESENYLLDPNSTHAHFSVAGS